MLELYWEPEASDQLASILEYIAQQNAAAALRVDELINGRVELSRQFPEIGRPGRVAGTRELIAHPNYIVVYVIEAERIRILQALHARQRYPD